MVTVGIDEVGRGCWAGPLVAGAVVLDHAIEGLRDSKKLSAQRREILAETIHLQASAVGLGWVWPLEIDTHGLSWAVKTAMLRAYTEINTAVDSIIIDGSINYFPHLIQAQAVIRADDTVPSVSAASIVAKVARDRYMRRVAHLHFPHHAFDRHVGYGTRLHIERLAEHGITPEHRQSYKPIRAILETTT